MLTPSSAAARLKVMQLQSHSQAGSSQAVAPSKGRAAAAAARHAVQSTLAADSEDSEPEVISPAPAVLAAKAKAVAAKPKAIKAVGVKAGGASPKVAFGRIVREETSPAVVKKAAVKRKPKGGCGHT